MQPSTVQKRINQTILSFLQKTSPESFPQGKLILIVDGLWTNFRKEGRFTLYLMAVRAVNDNVAHFLDPVLLPGRESLTGWEMAIAAIPNNVQGRICAMISDGLRGIKSIAENRRWHFQRCHFHLLASFQKKHGQWFRRGKSKWLRDAVMAYVRELLETTDGKRTTEFSKELLTLINHGDCPNYIQMRVREFLRTMDDFKTYLRYPELNLPVTSNTVETMIRLLRNLLKRIHGTRTPNSFLRWTTMSVRRRKTIACNGKKSTELIL
jgi:transposase